MKRVTWKNAPARRDCVAAATYLALLADPVTVGVLIEGLRSAPIERYKAKDILRAAGLRALPIDDVHVAKDLARIKAKTALAPVLLVRGDLRQGTPLQIADGYHRVCASRHVDEDIDIPCRVAGLAEPG